MEAFYQEFGRRVREARRNANRMTQETLARRLRLSRTSITNIEKGDQGVPLHTFVQMAAILGVEPAFLLPAAALGDAPEPVPARLLGGLDKAERRFVGRVVADQ